MRKSESSVEIEPSTGIPRRTMVAAIAWSVPVITLAVATPAAAASISTITVSPTAVSAQPGAEYPAITISLESTSEEVVTITLPEGWTWADEVREESRAFSTNTEGVLILTGSKPAPGTGAAIVAPTEPRELTGIATVSAMKLTASLTLSIGEAADPTFLATGSPSDLAAGETVTYSYDVSVTPPKGEGATREITVQFETFPGVSRLPEGQVEAAGWRYQGSTAPNKEIPGFWTLVATFGEEAEFAPSVVFVVPDLVVPRNPQTGSLKANFSEQGVLLETIEIPFTIK